MYGILATNERDHGWMDEGMNTYYENRYINSKYIRVNKQGFINNKLPASEDTLLLNSLIKLYKDQPVDMTAPAFFVVTPVATIRASADYLQPPRSLPPL